MSDFPKSDREMGRTMQKRLILLIFLYGLKSHAQNLEVKSFYPATALVAKRMLPFEVSGTEGIKVTKISLEGGNTCQSLVDPFYSHIFHIYCTSPEIIDVAVTVTHDFDSFDYILTFNNVSVVERREPSAELDSVSREDPDAEEGT